MKNNFNFYIILLVLFLMIPACKSLKRVTDKPQLEMKSTEYLVSKLNEANIEYEWFSSRVRFRFQFGGDVLNSIAQIRMKKDSLIWISVTPAFGLEMMRVLITPDSFKIIDRTSRTYQAHPYRHISKYMAIDTIDFEALQKIISGNLFYDLNNFTADVDTSYFILKNNTQFHQKTIKVIPDIYRPAIVLTEKPVVRQYMKIEYSKFEDLETFKFPMQIEISLKMPEIMNILIEHSRVSLDDSPNVSFTIPDSYEKRY